MYLNVTPARAIWSKYAFSCDGTPKLYIGKPNDDHVGLLELLDQCVRVGDHRVLRSVALVGLGDEGAEPLAVEMRHRLGRGHIAHHHLVSG